MTRRPPEPIDVEYEERDVVDSFPPLGRSATHLERSLGPSCLLSLVIVFLLLVVLRRFMNFGWMGTGILAVAIWYGVFALLVRWRPIRVDDE
jgi:hypothetical protein